MIKKTEVETRVTLSIDQIKEAAKICKSRKDCSRQCPMFDVPRCQEVIECVLDMEEDEDDHSDDGTGEGNEEHGALRGSERGSDAAGEAGDDVHPEADTEGDGVAEGSEDPDYIDIRLKASEGECGLLIALPANAYQEVCQTRDEEQKAECRALLENIFNQIKEKCDFMLGIIAKAMLDEAEQQAKSDK